MKNTAISSLVVIIVLGCPIVWCQGLPSTTPENVGVSTDRLARIDDFVERHLEAHHFAGAVTVVARHGQVVQFKAYGMQDIEAGVPMSEGSIFRIYSMTKPITSVAVMMLFEEGHFLLNDPVSRYLPEFEGLEVGVEEVDEATQERVLKTVPTNREVSIRDLLRHTSGLTYGFWGSSLVDEMYLEKKVLTEDETIQDTVSKLATIPLKHRPGTVWEYSLSTDVLGRFVEVVAGQPFDEFLEERIFEPLGMEDTGFFVPSENVERLTTVYTPNEENTVISPQESGESRDFTKRTRYFSGGGGLVSTAADYLRFSQMLLNGGELDDVRILGLETVELMTQDHLGDVHDRRDLGSYGFGLGFGIAVDRGISGSILSGGSYGWGGMAHTGFWIDPREDLIFRPVVYQSVID